MDSFNGTLIILSPGFAADEADSTCLPAQQSLVRALNRLFPGLQVIVVTFQYPYSAVSYHWHGNTVIPLNGQNKGGINRLTLWLKAWRTLSVLRKQHRITGLLSFWLGEAALVGSYFAARYRYRHFTWLLGQDVLKKNHYPKWMPLRKESLVAISDFMADNLLKSHAIQVQHTIPNGIDPKIFPAIPAARDIDILAVGSLIPLKQYAVFIDIVAAVHKQMPGLTVVLCGKGPEKERLQHRIHQYGLEAVITLTGEKPHEEILALMQRSRLLLHPSASEGFSGSCLEALYAGAHVISFFSPMHVAIDHWHIVKDAEEMQAETLRLLGPGHSHQRVLAYDMNDSARAFMQLFSGKPEADPV